ncbi:MULTISPECIES: hypothetical protein [unclassified Methylobacterium]|uniref:hypothetical protein n=1 Tax=unclassified Methylobacterium TaxID=2615210 RepID=UPI001365F0DF|nr:MULTISPECIES: hypothetical protein [unclassified Methylobacterium]MCJ2102271.1 hypothetical protein [Methylobacterium sp. E-046]
MKIAGIDVQKARAREKLELRPESQAPQVGGSNFMAVEKDQPNQMDIIEGKHLGG